MNKNMIKILALITALSAAMTVGIVKLSDTNEDEVYEYLNESRPTISQEYEEDTIPTYGTKVEETIEVIQPSPTEKEEEIIVEEKNEYIVVQANSDVNVRSGASISTFKIGNLQVNEKAILILSTENGWDLVKYSGGLGFVNNDYLTYTSEKYEYEYNHEEKKDIVLTNTDLNFRRLPTTDGEKIDTLEVGTELQVLAEVDNGWLLVRHNGELGYVSGEYTTSLLDKLNEKYPYLNAEELEIKKVVYTNTTELNLREEPNTDSEIQDKLTIYETLRVIAENDEWSLVMTNDYNFGFVFKEYTKELTGTFITVDKGEQTLTMYNDNEVLVQTPVTTGKDSTPSDTGNFSIYSKERDRYLTGPGYRSFVEYWMPFNGGEGIHDASWRSSFGGEGYHTGGSHGCINTPTEAVEKIWEKAEVGTKVLVHK